jgi:DNA processing protein
MSGPSDREVAAAALASLPGATASRLRALWKRHGTPQHAMEAVRKGQACDLLPKLGTGNKWPRRADPDVISAQLQRRSTRVMVPDDVDWPIDDALLRQPPGILFVEGERFEALHRPKISIVGTRAASPHGIADARDIAHAAASAGYTIVSGLALGIDGAAHRGAINAHGLTVGVIATGSDVVYPRRHANLFARVRAEGLIIGEYPFGTQPETWRFPVRNRIIAALGMALVVVEAKSKGGALSTVEHALRAGRDILAVPGSRRNPAAAGTNALLRDGAIALLEPRDLFVALGRAGEHTGWSGVAGVPLSTTARRVATAFAGDAATLDDLVGRTGLAVAEVAGALRELERVGHVTRQRGLLWPT